MSIELKLLTWTLLLALAQIFLHATLRTRETGPAYNLGPRDTGGPPSGKITARLFRAQKNLFETLPLFIAAVLIAHVAGRESDHTALGCWLYFGGRVVYVPLYALGIPVARTLAYGVAAAGLIMVIFAAL